MDFLMNPFYERVYGVVARIPFGRVVSYGQIARALDRPRAAREVGRAMRLCPGHLPWQRVVMADGSIAGGAHADTRRAVLESEGVSFLPDGRVDMESCRWSLMPLLTAPPRITAHGGKNDRVAKCGGFPPPGKTRDPD